MLAFSPRTIRSSSLRIPGQFSVSDPFFCKCYLTSGTQLSIYIYTYINNGISRSPQQTTSEDLHLPRIEGSGRLRIASAPVEDSSRTYFIISSDRTPNIFLEVSEISQASRERLDSFIILGGSRMEVSTRTVIAVTWMVCSLLASASAVDAKKGPKYVELFVHESRIPPATLFLVAPVAGELTNRQAGSILVIDNVLRVSNASDSDVMGRQLGQVAVGGDNATFFVSYTFQFNEASGHPGTITVTGILQSGTLVVTGETGTFAFVRGIAFPQTVADTGATGVYKYNLELKY
ncbi:hypothetical protein Mapa_001175 [Marchantia paleacea]|nr:hypothetical protein Mapa_001175 [Marchantia paleacea]